MATRFPGRTSRSSSSPDTWPDEDSEYVTLGKKLRPLGCDYESYGVVYEGAIRVRCQSRRHNIPPGRVLFHYFSHAGVLLEEREGPYRKR